MGRDCDRDLCFRAKVDLVMLTVSFVRELMIKKTIL